MIYTIGYEELTGTEFINILEQEDIDILIDCRRGTNSSDKPEFSKGNLGFALADVGIVYLHEEALGTPEEQMNEVVKSGKGYDEDDLKEYLHHLTTNPEAVAALDRAAALAEKKTVALMCYESDYSNCHRRIVAEEISRKISVVHL